MSMTNTLLGRLLLLLFFVARVSQAASLTRTVYLTLPWGKLPGQVGRYVPAKGEDASLAGPVEFAIGEDGKTYLADIQTSRVQVFQKGGSFLHEVQFSKANRDLVEGIDVDPQGTLYLVGDFGKVQRDRKGQLRIYHGTRLLQTLDSAQVGIQSPLNVEVDRRQTLLVQDNNTFVTTRMDRSGNILEQVYDEGLMWLCSKGLYKYSELAGTMRIATRNGQKVAEYGPEIEDLRAVGVTRAGVLYVVYNRREANDHSKITTYLEGRAASGRTIFSLVIQDELDRDLLSPRTFRIARVGRVGPDDAIYVDNDKEDQYRIYRYEIRE